MVDPAEMARWTDNQADALRDVAATRYAAQTGTTGVERDAAARRQWAAAQEAKAALQQVEREAAARDTELAAVAHAEQEAAALDAAGRMAEAEDRREFAIGLRAKAEAAETRWSAAADAAVDADQAARALGEQVAKLEAKLAEIGGQAHAAHDAAEALDARADLYRQAVPLDAEADRLEALAARLRAEGDDIVLPDVERDAAAARQAADAAIAKAEAAAVDRAVVIDVLGDAQGAAEPTSIPEPVAELDSDPVLGGVAAAEAAVASPPHDADAGAAEEGAVEDDAVSSPEPEPELTADLAAPDQLVASVTDDLTASELDVDDAPDDEVPDLEPEPPTLDDSIG
jgi:hypothetical protein